jgi:hypothetical protein
MARSPKTDDTGAAKPARTQGPRKLFLVLKPGTDVAAIRQSISAVTFNGRKMLDMISGSNEPCPFLTYTIVADKRGKPADDLVADGSAEQV